jgi:hypothetical protein
MRFLRTDGTPLANATIHAQQAEFVGFEAASRPWSISHPLKTDADGVADVSGLRGGLEHEFLRDSRGGLPGWPFARTTVKDGAVVTEKEEE